MQPGLSTLRAVVRSAPLAMVLIDKDYTVSMWNAAAERIFGWTAEEIVGRRFPLIPADRDAEFRQHVTTLDQGNVVENKETVRQHKDGSLIEVGLSASAILDDSGVSLGWIAAYVDLSTRRVDRKSRRPSDMEAILQAFPDIYFWMDADGTFLDYHAGDGTHLLETPDRFLGRRIAELFEPDLADVFLQTLQRTLSTRETQSLDYTLHLEFGVRHFEARYVPVAGDRVLAIIRDITERRRLEEEVRQAQKMEAIGRLAGGVAHDFNNLLTVITSFAEILRRDAPTEGRTRSDLAQILRAADRASSLTRQLLAFSRRRVSQVRVVALGAVVRESQKMLRRLIGEDIRIETEVSTDPLVRADPGHLEQVLVNLVVNARDAMPEGGVLRLSVHQDDDAGEAVLTVTDAGQGMDDETLSRIFEPFFTTKPPGVGTGLGLSTVYGIVRQAGGRVEVDSVPGAGSTFRVRLPQVRSEAVPDPPEPEPQASGGTETLLVIEDEESVRRLARRALESEGYTVLDAPDGLTAVALVEALTGPLDLVVTDVVMPHMNGREAVELIQGLRPGVRAVFMTGFAVDEVLQDRISVGDAVLLEKPFSLHGLARAVRQALDRPARRAGS